MWLAEKPQDPAEIVQVVTYIIASVNDETTRMVPYYTNRSINGADQ